MPLVVSVDYDDTFTLDPSMWRKIIEIIEASGHVVVCCTFRKEHDEITDFPGEVFYTGGLPKAQFMEDAGVPVDIWIDDWPELIGNTRRDG